MADLIPKAQGLIRSDGLVAAGRFITKMRPEPSSLPRGTGPLLIYDFEHAWLWYDAPSLARPRAPLRRAPFSRRGRPFLSATSHRAPSGVVTLREQTMHGIIEARQGWLH